MKDILPKDENGLLHGYCEQYYSNGNLSFKGNHIHGSGDGYFEYHYMNGGLFHHGNYLNGKRIGYWEHHIAGELFNKYYYIQ